MNGLKHSERTSARRLLTAVIAVGVIASLTGIIVAADAAASGARAESHHVIDGCVNRASGALRVRTPHHKSCGSEKRISWNQAGPAGNGYAFSSMTGTLNKYNIAESDGPVVKKAGTYFVNFTGKLNISAFTTGGAGFCYLDLVHGTTSTTFIFKIFSTWNYPAPAANINNAYPFASSGMISVPAKQVGFQLITGCFDNSFDAVPVTSGTWLVSPVSAKPSGTVSIGQSVVGPAGFRAQPALAPRAGH